MSDGGQVAHLPDALPCTFSASQGRPNIDPPQATTEWRSALAAPPDENTEEELLIRIAFVYFLKNPLL